MKTCPPSRLQFGSSPGWRNDGADARSLDGADLQREGVRLADRQHRVSEAVRVAGTEAGLVVHRGHVYPPGWDVRAGQVDMRVFAIAYGDHAAAEPLADEVHGDVGEGDRNHLIQRVGFAAAQVV